VKSIIRSLAINFFTIWFFSQVYPGVKIEGGYLTIFWAAVAFGLLNLIVRPVLSLLLLPINLLTLGAFRFVIGVIILFLLAVIVPGFSLQSFSFGGFSNSGIVLPAAHISLLWSYVIGSFIISIINSFIVWLLQ